MLDIFFNYPAVNNKNSSIIAKWKIFNFSYFAACQNAVIILASHVDRIEAFMSVIGSSSSNWENPKVRSLLASAGAIDPDEMRDSTRACDAAILEFSQNTYWEIYG